MAAKKILVAEDEKPMAKALEMKLNASGFEAKAVFDGEAAVNELSSLKYDLALIDIMMPKMSGFDVLEELKKKRISCPVIIASNLSQEEDVNRAKSLGAKDFIVKSNTPISEIVERVKKQLS